MIIPFLLKLFFQSRENQFYESSVFLNLFYLYWYSFSFLWLDLL